jgi:acyl carrier protein
MHVAQSDSGFGETTCIETKADVTSKGRAAGQPASLLAFTEQASHLRPAYEAFSCREKPIRQRPNQMRTDSARNRRKSPLSTTFDKVAKIIADTSEIDIETITPESHTIDDLGIDSLDFLDIVFAIDKEFGIKVPLEKWTQEVNDGKASTDDYFVMKNLCAKIDALVAAKTA